jgi:hypothetical protein
MVVNESRIDCLCIKVMGMFTDEGFTLVCEQLADKDRVQVFVFRHEYGTRIRVSGHEFMVQNVL